MDAGSFAHRVGAAYSRKLDVPVRGYGGYNSAMATPLFDEIFARKGDSSSLVRMVTVWFGGSESDTGPGPGPGRSKVQADLVDWSTQALTLTHALEQRRGPDPTDDRFGSTMYPAPHGAVDAERSGGYGETYISEHIC